MMHADCGDILSFTFYSKHDELGVHVSTGS
jgi:hypothetical protein